MCRSLQHRCCSPTPMRRCIAFCQHLWHFWTRSIDRSSLEAYRIWTHTKHCSQVDIGSVDLLLEFWVFVSQLLQVGFVFFNIDGFLGSQVVKGIYDGISEFVQGLNDLSHDTLVWEVLVGCKGDEGLDHWGHHGSGSDLALDMFEWVLESLNLQQWWVGESAQQGQCLVNWCGGVIQLSNLEFEVLMLLGSDKDGLLVVLSVGVLVLLNNGYLVLELFLSGV